MSPEGTDMKMAIYVVIFVGAIAQDLLWRKVKNIYVIAAFLAAFLFQIVQIGFVPSLALLLNLVIALGLGIVLYMLKILGAGDVKIFSVSALLLPGDNIPQIYFYSLFWGAVFGVIRYIISGRLLVLIQNLFFASNKATRAGIVMQPIPFTVAFLLGALTDWTLKNHGVSFL